MPNQKTDPELLKALAEMDKAYSSANRKWFDFLADDIIVFSTNNVEPFKGKKAYMAHFSDSLVSAKRNVEVLQRDILTMGDVSIVYQTTQVDQGGIIVNLKQSQVWKLQKEGDWKVNHIHTAMIGSPQPKDPGASKISGIKVINEKIASMASMVGVAQ